MIPEPPPPRDNYPIRSAKTYRGAGYAVPEQGAAGRPAALVMTATIAPPESATNRADPRLRLEDYKRSLRFYLELPAGAIDRILLIDNSGSDLSELEALVEEVNRDKLVELLSFEGNDHNPRLGKSFGEFKLLDFGLSKASLLAPGDFFWKVTGRLKVLNLAALIGRIEAPYDLVCDLHNIPLVGKQTLRSNARVDLRMFGCTLDCYDALFRGQCYRHGKRLSAGYLYRVILDARPARNILPRFPAEPRFDGYSGRHNRHYNAGLQRVKTELRAAARQLFPGLWL